MEDKELRDLESLFAQVEDPPMERTTLHRLRDSILVAICGAEGWVEIEEFGKATEAFFTDLLDLAHGRPSHDTFGRVFVLIDPKPFEASFVPWVQGIGKTVKGGGAMDGKTLRRTQDQRAGKKALQLVSAWPSKTAWSWLNWQPKKNPTRSRRFLFCCSSEPWMDVL